MNENSEQEPVNNPSSSLARRRTEFGSRSSSQKDSASLLGARALNAGSDNRVADCDRSTVNGRDNRRAARTERLPGRQHEPLSPQRSLHREFALPCQ
jgi:hypothetical protein